MSPIISGGGAGGGNTTAQVVASGKVLPVAKAAGVTVDTTTYNDPVSSSGKLTTLIFASDAGHNFGDQGLLAIAVAGDAFPRVLLASDPTDGWFFGAGDANPYTAGTNLRVAFSTTGQFSITAPSFLDLAAGAAGEVRISAPSGTVEINNLRAAAAAAEPPLISQLSPKFTITSGALPTVQLVTATGAQILTTRDAETITPVTFNPGVATTATCLVELSPDNVTYSTLGVETEPVGTVLDGTIHLVKVRVPAGWYLKLTANAQAALGVTTYY